DDIAGRGEADDGHQVAGGAVARAVQFGFEEGLGRYDRVSGVDEAFGVGEGGQAGDDGLQAVVGGGVGGVEGPVAAAFVLVVVGVAGGLADLGVGVGRVDPGEVLGGGFAAPGLDDHLGGGGAAPCLSPVVVLRVLALVDLLRVAGYVQLPADSDGLG